MALSEHCGHAAHSGHKSVNLLLSVVEGERRAHDTLLSKNAHKKDEQKYCSDLQVSRVTPPACILLSDDDHTVMPINGVNYYTELYRHDVPATLHVYPGGGHGWEWAPASATTRKC